MDALVADPVHAEQIGMWVPGTGGRGILPDRPSSNRDEEPAGMDPFLPEPATRRRKSGFQPAK
jgi:hypothetical protein